MKGDSTRSNIKSTIDLIKIKDYVKEKPRKIKSIEAICTFTRYTAEDVVANFCSKYQTINYVLQFR